MGEAAAFPAAPAENGRRISEFRDGTSNTISLVNTGHAVVWTSPEDLKFNPETFLETQFEGDVIRFGSDDHWIVSTCDGAVHSMARRLNAVDRTIVKSMMTFNGGEIIPRVPGAIRSPTDPKKIAV